MYYYLKHSRNVFITHKYYFLTEVRKLKATTSSNSYHPILHTNQNPTFLFKLTTMVRPLKKIVNKEIHDWLLISTNLYTSECRQELRNGIWENGMDQDNYARCIPTSLLHVQNYWRYYVKYSRQGKYLIMQSHQSSHNRTRWAHCFTIS